MGRKTKKSVTKTNTAWPKPAIKGAVQPDQSWFVDTSGEGESTARKRPRTYDFAAEKAAKEVQKEEGRKTRAKLGIKGSVHEHVKVQKMATRLKAQAQSSKGKGKAGLEDVWGEDLVAKARPKDEWLAAGFGTEAVPTRYKKKARRAPEPTPVPAVVVAHPGASLRPEEEQRAHLEEIATGKELTRLDDKTVREEMRKGVPRPEGVVLGAHHDTDEESDEEGDRSHRQVVANKLTKAQRNKQRRLKEQAAQAAAAKAAKAKDRQLNRHGEVKKQLAKEEAAREKQRQEAAAHRAEMAKVQPKKLSRHTYVETRPEVKLAEEVPSNLRELEVEGNLFRDRFQSLQKRNIIEPRGIHKKKRRYKLKVKHYVNTNGTGLNGLAAKEPGTRHTLTPEEKGPMQPHLRGKKRKKAE